MPISSRVRETPAAESADARLTVCYDECAACLRQSKIAGLRFLVRQNLSQSMHELSIANCLVETVLQQMEDQPGCRVQVVHLRVGELSGVHRDPLLFSFDLVTEGTPLAGARLEIVSVPVTIFCSSCARTVPLDGIQSFRCPSCHTLSADIRSGRELELHSLELADTPSEDLSNEEVIK